VGVEKIGCGRAGLARVVGVVMGIVSFFVWRLVGFVGFGFGFIGFGLIGFVFGGSHFGLKKKRNL